MAQALPSALSMLVENLQFMVITVWAGQFDTASLASHSVGSPSPTTLLATQLGVAWVFRYPSILANLPLNP